MKSKIYKYIIIVILLLISCYLGATILNNKKKQHFINTNTTNCDKLFKKAEKYKIQLRKFNTLKSSSIKILTLEKELNDKLELLLELYTVSHTCLGQQIVIDDIKDIKIEVLEKAIKELSVDCHKQILDCYKNKFIKNIESLVSLKIKKYIYNTDVFTVDDNSILPLNYFIKQLQTQMNEHKSILLDELDSNPLLKTYSNNLMNILLNISQEINAIDKTQFDSYSDSFLKVYKYIYNIYNKNIDLQKDVTMSIINSNETTNKPLSNDELTQKYIDNKANSESKVPINIFDLTYLTELEDNLLKVYLVDINKALKLIGGSNSDKINLIKKNSIEPFFENLYSSIIGQDKASNKITKILDISNDLLETIKSNNKTYN